MSKINNLFWLNKAKATRKGEIPLYLRITVDGKRTEIATNYTISSEHLWDSKKQAVKGKSEEANLINAYITTTKSKILKIENEFTISGNIPTSELIKQKLLGKEAPKKTLLELFDDYNNRVKEQLGKDYSKSTYTQYQDTKHKITTFLKVKYSLKDIALEDLNYKFAADFELYLKSNLGLQNNSAMKKIKQLKTVTKYAILNDWLTKNPFVSYQCTYKDPNREALTKDELERIENKTFLTERLNVVKDVFLFSCYTGLRFSDVSKLEPENIVNENGKAVLNFSTIKTKNKSKIPLLPQALAIIEKYRNNPECLYKNSLLPVRSNQKMNEYLKEIADLTGIEKNLHFHLARHTFATTVALDNGASIEVVSKMLGHASIRTTQIYAKMTDSRVSDEMDIVKSRIEIDNNIKKQVKEQTVLMN